jgi:serine/threonine protein kinase
VERKNHGKGKNIRVGLPITQVRDYLKDMLKALHYCHNITKVFHRDIKPDNIMINHNNEAILIDFGVSALKGDDDFLQTKMGTLLYFAPEMFQSGGKNFKV